MHGTTLCTHPSYYGYTQEQLEIQLKEYKEVKVRGEGVLALETELFELYKDLDLKVTPKQLESRGGAHYSDAAYSLIYSIYNDSQDIQYVNTSKVVFEEAIDANKEYLLQFHKI